MGVRVRFAGTAFIEGQRIRPGQVVELPDGMTPPRGAEIDDDEGGLPVGKATRPDRPAPSGPRTLSEMTRQEAEQSAGRGFMWTKAPGLE